MYLFEREAVLMLCSLGSDFISGFLFVNVGVDLQMSRAISFMHSVAKGSTSWWHVPCRGQPSKQHCRIDTYFLHMKLHNYIIDWAAKPG